MKQNIAQQLIDQTNGKFFSITFVKKDGSERTVNGKDKYNRLLRGGDNKVAQAGYQSAVNRNKESWFAFKGEKIKRFKCGAIEQTFSV